MYLESIIQTYSLDDIKQCLYIIIENIRQYTNSLYKLTINNGDLYIKVNEQQNCFIFNFKKII